MSKQATVKETVNALGHLPLQEIIDHLRAGDLKALANVPKGMVMQAMAENSKRGSRKVGVTVYAASGSIGITGIRVRPIVAYKAEWDAIAAFMATDAFKAALADPAASTGNDDPRFEAFRAERSKKQAADRVAREGQ